MKDLTTFSFNVGNIGIKLYMRGFSIIGDKTGSPRHSHTEFEYHFIMRGNAILQFDDKKMILEENSAIVVFPNVSHRFLKSETETSVLSLSFSIKKNKSGIDYFSGLKPNSIKNGFVVIENTADLIPLIISTVYSKRLFAVEEMRSLLTLLFTNIIRKLSNSNTDNEILLTQEYDRGYIIEEFFNKQFMNDVTLTDLASQLYLSNQQTERTVKKIYNEGFNKHLTKVRIDKAQKLLMETKKSVVEIAELVGYNSYNGFYIAFKKETNTNPIKWKENNLK